MFMDIVKTFYLLSQHKEVISILMEVENEYTYCDGHISC